MRLFKKITSVMAAVVISLAAFVGCGGGGESGKDLNVVTPDAPYNHLETLHEYKASETGKFVVSGGKTDYAIVIPENYAANENLAASELQRLFGEATKINLQILTEGENALPAGKYISLGRTKLFAASNADAKSELLGSDGFIIKTVGDDIFVCGGGNKGTLYGVYELLGHMLGYEMYAPDCYSLDKNVTELKLMNYDVTEKPDYAKRLEGYKFVRDDATCLNNFRQSSYLNSFMFVNGREVHNSFNYLPPEKFSAEHRSWYSEGMEQLCYTAHGNKEEYEAMLEESFKVMKQVIIQSPELDTITFTQQDIKVWCTCDTCKASYNKYGTDAAVVIKFCNALNKKVRAWMDSDEGKEYKRDLAILFFAYYTTVPAPVKLTENGYVPIDDTVKCDEGVYAFYAPLPLDYTSSIYGEANRDYKENFEKWAAVSDRTYVWVYSTNFQHFLAPYDNFSSMQELYNFVRGTKAYMLYDQSQMNQNGGATGFHVLKAYLTAKLQWNTQADYVELIDNFFANYYGRAVEPMRKYFDELRVHIAKLKAQGVYGGRESIYQDMSDISMWQLPILERWNGYIDEALNEIEAVKNIDNAAYETYVKHVVQERVFLNYMFIEKYSAKFSVAEVEEMKKEFISDVTLVGLSNTGEHRDINDLIKIYSE